MSKIQKKGNESYLNKHLSMLNDVLIKIGNSAEKGVSHPEIIDYIEKNHLFDSEDSAFNLAKFAIKELIKLDCIENETSQKYRATIMGLQYNLQGGFMDMYFKRAAKKQKAEEFNNLQLIELQKKLEVMEKQLKEQSDFFTSSSSKNEAHTKLITQQKWTIWLTLIIALIALLKSFNVF